MNPSITSSNPSMKTAMSWRLVNALSQRLCQRLGPERAIRLRYEDLISQPEVALERIGALIELDFDDVRRQLLQERLAPTGHLIAGNRMRMSSTIRMKPDLEWKTSLPGSDRRIIDMMCGSMLSRYGYDL